MKRLTIYEKLKIKTYKFSSDYKVIQILFSSATGCLNYKQNQSYKSQGTSIHLPISINIL